MPRLCPCPRCFRDLTILDLADKVTQLVCPICREVFAAAEVRESGDPLPPAAIPLAAEQPAEMPGVVAHMPPATVESSVAAQAASSPPGPQLAVSEAAALISEQPQSLHPPPEAPFPLPGGEPASAESATPAAPVTEGYDPLASGAYDSPASTPTFQMPAEGEMPHHTTVPAPSGERDLEPAPPTEPGHALREPPSPWSDAPAYNGLLSGSGGADDDATPTSQQYWSDDSSSELARAAELGQESAAREEGETPLPPALKLRTPGRPPRRFGVLGQMAGVVVGGALGVAIGYYLLVLILGARGDFLELRSKLPPWMLPGGNSTDDQDADGVQAPQRRRPSQQRGGIPSRPLLPAADKLPSVNAAAPAAVEEAVAWVPADAGHTLAAEQTPWGKPSYAPRDVEHSVAATALSLGCGRFAEQNTAESSAASSGKAYPSGPMACAACASRTARAISLRAYNDLCRLAETTTLLRSPPYEQQRAELRNRVCGLLACVVASPSRLAALGRLAGQRLRSRQPAVGGIALAGTVRALSQDAGRFSLGIVLFGEPLPVTVVASSLPTTPVVPGDRVVVLGYLPEDGSISLAGATSGSTPVVWGGLCYPLP
ncbi:MAG: hypothetical protein K6T86_06340 [Pirellulales bacterium]|nr:hypothetical protein [Pirellulales bacterium]